MAEWKHGANEHGGVTCEVSRKGRVVRLDVIHESSFDAEDLYKAISSALRTRGEFTFKFGGQLH